MNGYVPRGTSLLCPPKHGDEAPLRALKKFPGPHALSTAEAVVSQPRSPLPVQVAADAAGRPWRVLDSACRVPAGPTRGAGPCPSDGPLAAGSSPVAVGKGPCGLRRAGGSVGTAWLPSSQPRVWTALKASAVPWPAGVGTDVVHLICHLASVTPLPPFSPSPSCCTSEIVGG